MLTTICERPTVMNVNLKLLAENFKKLCQAVSPSVVMPIMKANAYGHGLIECGLCLQTSGAKILGVAYVEEALALRQAGATLPILVLGGIFGEQVHHFIQNDLSLSASSVFKLEAIDQVASDLKKKARIHLKIDTGMERIGTHYYSAEKLLKRAIELKNCVIEGIFSHFARADEQDLTFTRLQLERFLECVSFFEKRSLPTPMRHLANSAGLLSYPESHLDMVRPGVCLYGVMPAQHIKNELELSPVMSLVSKVAYFKVVKKGAGVSYGHTWIAPEDSRVVTIPIGYGDGYFRRLSNSGEVIIREKAYPIVGSVCMDQLMVNISQGEAYNGDEVVLIGRQGASRCITIEEIAGLSHTVPHEVLVSINNRIPRHYISP